MARKQNDLRALRNLIGEAQTVIRTTKQLDDRTSRADELLTAAVHLADHLLEVSPAAELGKKGGKATAKRGPEYFARIAGMRKEKKGGRPRMSPAPIDN